MKLTTVMIALANGLTLFAQSKVESDIRERGDQVAAAMQAEARSLLPDGVTAKTTALDGRVMSWEVSLSEDFCKEKFERSAGEAEIAQIAAMEKWVDDLSEKLLNITIDFVRSAGHDPEFSPDVDIQTTVSWFAFRENLKEVHRASYTGSRRNEELDPETHKMTRMSSGPPAGGEIEVLITQDKANWGFREHICGSLSIRNCGRNRIHLPRARLNWVEITDSGGRETNAFARRICSDPAPNAATLVFLGGGETIRVPFEIATDPLDRIHDGYVVPPGEWFLVYRGAYDSNVLLRCAPQACSVTLEDGKSAEPRILTARGLDDELILLREDNTVQLVSNRDWGRVRFLDLCAEDAATNIDDGVVFSRRSNLVGYRQRSTSTIRVRTFPACGDPASVDGVDLGLNADLTPIAFSSDERSLSCEGSGKIIVVALSSGEILRTFDAPSSDDLLCSSGDFLAVLHPQGLSVAGKDDVPGFSIRILNLTDGVAREVPVITSGQPTAMEVHTEGHSLWISSRNSNLFTRVHLPTGLVTEFHLTQAVRIVGESTDGSLVAFASVEGHAIADANKSRCVIHDTKSGREVRSMELPGAWEFVLLSNPIEVVAMELRTSAPECGAVWLSNSFLVLDGTTGATSRSVTISRQ